jgi:hypothetical protein
MLEQTNLEVAWSGCNLKLLCFALEFRLLTVLVCRWRAISLANDFLSRVQFRALAISAMAEGLQGRYSSYSCNNRRQDLKNYQLAHIQKAPRFSVKTASRCLWIFM